MSAESAPVVYGPPTLEESLRQYSNLALHIARGRAHQGDGNPYDRFLNDYLGPTDTGAAPAIHRPDIQGTWRCYDQQLLRSYTPDGRLVNVRSTSDHTPGAGYYFVAAADLMSGEIVEWPVKKLKTTGEGDRLCSKLILETMIVPPADVPLQPPADVIGRVLQQREQQRGETEVPTRYVVLRNGCSEYYHDGKSEPLSPIGRLAHEVNQLASHELPAVAADVERLGRLTSEAAESMVAQAVQSDTPTPYVTA